MNPKSQKPSKAWRIAMELTCLFMMGSATAETGQPTPWTTANRNAAQSILECRTPLTEKSPILRLLTVLPAPENEALWIGTAEVPENLRVFGLPGQKVYFFRTPEKNQKTFVAITVFHEAVTWEQIIQAAQLKAQLVMDEETYTRKTPAGRLEIWPETPFWVELAQQQPDTVPRIYLSCSAGSDTEEEEPGIIMKGQITNAF